MTTFVLLATGPSFRQSDAMRLRSLGPTMAVNNAVYYAPWSAYLYACDAPWWDVHAPKIRWYKGERWCHQPNNHGAKVIRKTGAFKRFAGNSGNQAIQLAVHLGARKIILLGYDHMRSKTGEVHVHGDHPHPLGNPPENLDHWVRQMNYTASDLIRLGVEVINCSRETALTCFPRKRIEEVL